MAKGVVRICDFWFRDAITKYFPELNPDSIPRTIKNALYQQCAIRSKNDRELQYAAAKMEVIKRKKLRVGGLCYVRDGRIPYLISSITEEADVVLKYRNDILNPSAISVCRDKVFCVVCGQATSRHRLIDLKCENCHQVTELPQGRRYCCVCGAEENIFDFVIMKERILLDSFMPTFYKTQGQYGLTQAVRELKKKEIAITASCKELWGKWYHCEKC